MRALSAGMSARVAGRMSMAFALVACTTGVHSGRCTLRAPQGRGKHPARSSNGGTRRYLLRVSLAPYPRRATNSISTSAPNGNPATATVVRAGYGRVKRAPYALFMCGKFAMSVR